MPLLPPSAGPLNHAPYHYPWREGNHFELLVDGEQFFPAMLQAIEQAQKHVFLEIYLIESGEIAARFIHCLSQAVARGVAVYLLLDDFGARGLSKGDIESLQHAGIYLTFYNPLRYGKYRRNLFRDHRKLLIVDQAVAFTGGAGITDEFYIKQDDQPAWHETMIAIRGPVVADWEDLFIRNWNHWSNDKLTQQKTPGPGRARRDGSPGRVTINAPTRMELKRSLIKRLRSAERRIWLATAYFIPSWKIRRALLHAARQGTDVRLLLPGPLTDHPAVRHAGRRFYGRLLRGGVRIFEYQPRFLHAKLLLCDNWASIGSSNIDRWNLRWNLEASQEIDDQDFSDQLVELFEKDFSQSRELHYAQWVARSRWHRLQEWFWGRIDILLERLSQRNKH